MKCEFSIVTCYSKYINFYSEANVNEEEVGDGVTQIYNSTDSVEYVNRTLIWNWVVKMPH